MTGKYVLLLRGINVNPTTRISMADLRDAVAGIGYENVTTLLQSGNVIVECSRKPDARALQDAIMERSGVSARVIALRASEFRKLADENPLLEVSEDLSKSVITFLDAPIVPGDIDRPAADDLAPEQLVITPTAIYQWCPLGILKSRLSPAWWRQFGTAATTRNVRTVNRILAALDTD
jgi:uncharacterized protein (DUF1697 family)